MAVKPTVKKITAWEILDSRGLPTVQAKVEVTGRVVGIASVPGGTSSGKYEAFEKRDEDASRYGGKGVLSSVRVIDGEISAALKGAKIYDQAAIDSRLIELDGTENKSRLGANTLLAVSLACARAGAECAGLPLYEYLRLAFGNASKQYLLPQPMFNLLNGGAHAESGMDIQEFMLVPSAGTFSESYRYAAEVFQQLKRILQTKKMNTGVGLEGGFAPQLSGSGEALETLVAAAAAAKLPERAISIGIDVASSELYQQERGSRYIFKREGMTFTREQLIAWYVELAGKYPILSIEDGLHQEDFQGWATLTSRLGGSMMIVGDDFVVTNPHRLQKAIEARALNALIVKPNQIGTLTETFETIRLAQSHGITQIISHRSGETNDSFIADLAVGVGATYIKSGSVSRGERVAKYNRLLEIESELKLQKRILVSSGD